MKNAFTESLSLLKEVQKDDALLQNIQDAADMMIHALQARHKILWCGNGGSAADCQHLSAELVARLNDQRRALASLALTTDTSFLTAWMNDTNNSDHLFSRQIKALALPGDVLIAISTSGNSQNIVEALRAARDNKAKCIVLSGNRGGKLKGMSDIELIVPSDNTQRIQEIHIIIGHMICEEVEKAFISP